MSKNPKKTILVVDDDIDLLSQMKRRLEGFGFQVIAAESQAEGEKLIDTTTPDLAIFDLMMENRDSGFLLGYRMKKKSPKTPVILVTAVASETGVQFDVETEEEREWIKADVVLNKSVRYEQLKREIDRLLKEQAHA